MKVLVLGSTGMAGHTISIYFKERGYDVTALSIRPFKYCKNIILNVLDIESFKKVLIDNDFDVIINCIGILNENANENRPQAVYLNAYLPHLIAQTIKNKNTKLIHMSTDCVFAGNTGPYYENSFKDGLSFYDRSKALGEIVDERNLTFRNSIIGPDINHQGIGLFNWFMKQSGTIDGFSKAIWTGVSTITLARAMEQAIKVDLCGIFNLVNNTSISKFELLCLFNKYFRDNSVIIKENETLILDKTLRSKRDDFTFEVPTYEEMVVEMKDWIYRHKNLYPYYF